MSNILPDDPAAAVRQMIKLTQQLTQMVEAEGRSMTMNDAVSFSVNEQDKSAMVDQYEAASAEFTVRAGDVRQAVDGALFDELIKEQQQLKTVTESNNTKLEKIPGIKSANENG